MLRTCAFDGLARLGGAVDLRRPARLVSPRTAEPLVTDKRATRANL
jgi:hypothetical protein